MRSTRSQVIAEALGGQKAGNAWMARCPAHDDRVPSLAITDTSDGTVLVHCHAGCDQRDVIAALGSRGLWEAIGTRSGRYSRRHHRRVAEKPDAEVLKRTDAAIAIWQASKPLQGTLVETYLRSRGLCLPPAAELRFHAGLKHPSGGTWPAMVALVTRGTDGAPIAIHRTFLARNGNGKAPVDPQKMMFGPCRGGVVRLSESGGVLMIGEGIETCLTAMQKTGHAAWAGLSTSGLRTLNLPGDARNIIVLADGDEPGEAAAQNCAQRWVREGRLVRIARPPPGMDFNDLLRADAAFIEEDAR